MSLSNGFRLFASHKKAWGTAVEQLVFPRLAMILNQSEFLGDKEGNENNMENMDTLDIYFFIYGGVGYTPNY